MMSECDLKLASQLINIAYVYVKGLFIFFFDHNALFPTLALKPISLPV